MAIGSILSDFSTTRKPSLMSKNECVSAGGSTKDSHLSDEASNSDEEKIREEILDSYSKIWKAVPGGNPGITSGTRVSRSPDLLPSASSNSLCKSFASDLSIFTDPSPLLPPTTTPFIQRVELFESLGEELSPEKLKKRLHI